MKCLHGLIEKYLGRKIIANYDVPHHISNGIQKGFEINN